MDSIDRGSTVEMLEDLNSDRVQVSNYSVAPHIVNHGAAIVWLTGLSGAGKTSLARAAQKALESLGRRVVVLDGDALRTGLNSDLGFSSADRNESMRRTAEVARLMAETGIIVIVALISPYRQGRADAKRIAGGVPFLEVFVDTPHMICELRDPKGLYAKARSGEIKNFTSIADPYEAPETPDLVVKTQNWTINQSVAPLVAKVVQISACK